MVGIRGYLTGVPKANKESLEAADELREEFEAEGNLGIIEDRVSEAKAVLELFDSGRNSRYLYRVVKK